MGATAASELLARLPPAPHRTILPGSALLPGRHDSGASAAIAARFLAGLGETDRAIVVLAVGLGLDLGSVASALQLDASIVAWRLQRSLVAEHASIDPAALEVGLTQWLRGPADAVAAGAANGSGATTVAAQHVEALPADVRERLVARLDSQDSEHSTASRRPGLGVGSLVLILVAAAGFMVYGAVRDVNPLRRGMALVRLADYPAARTAFQELGTLPNGRAWIAITWLAEGDFEHANSVLAEPETARWLGEFRPMTTALPTLEADPASPMLLPRGLLANARPDFVFLANGTTELSLQQHPEEPDLMRRQRIPLGAEGTPTTEIAPGVVRLAFPPRWPDLTEGVVLWDVLGDEAEPMSFTLLPKETRRELAQRAAAHLDHEIPFAAREFLRAHFDLRNGLLVEASARFALLAGKFPDQAYPRQMLAKIGAALGVDPAVLVR